MARPSLHRLLIVLAVAALLVPVAAGAQTSATQAYINQTVGPTEIQTTDGLPGLSYEVDFTLLDAQQNVLTSPQVVTATLDLDPGGPYPAQTAQLTQPWFMTVLIDASSTLGVFSASSDFSQMRNTLATELGNLPEGYNVSVEKFDTAPHTVLQFTNAKDAINNAILHGFQPTTSGSACLNDGVMDAINNLSQAPGRHALLIVTASLDGCGKAADQAVALAQQNHIQIYAVGMLGYKVTDAKDLTYLTDATGGLAYAREPQDLRFAISNVLQALQSQWSAKATLYPSAGPETATVQLTLSDQTVINTQKLFFNVDKSFAQPASISLRGEVQSTQTGIQFGLDFVSPQLINTLKMKVTDKVTGNSINEQTLPGIQDTYDVPISNLSVGSTYELVVTAQDKTGATIGQPVGAEFQYQPPAAQLAITKVVTPTQAQPYYSVQVATVNLNNAVKFQAWLQPDGQTSTTTQLNLTEVPVGSPITITTNDLPAGVYDVGVAALDVSGNVLLTALSPKQPPFVPESSFEKTMAYLLANPIWIALMGGVGCLAMAVLLVAVIIIIPKPRGQPKAVELYVPEVKHRVAPMNLEASKSQSLPAQPAVPRPRPAPPPEPQPRVRDAEMQARPQVRPPESVAEPRAAVGMPKACLSGYAPADLRVAATVTKASYTIGRHDGNDLVVPVDNKIGVSGRHATIKYLDGRFFIVDDKSTFGTFVNEQRVPAGATMPLDDGAIIGLGPKVKIQFRLNCL